MGFDDRIIRLIRKHEKLYNHQHPDYRNLEAKAKVWAEIAADMKCTPELCKKRWKGLRDTYKRSQRGFKKLAGKEIGDQVKIWKHYDQMRFLDSVSKSRLSFTTDASIADDVLTDFDDAFEVVNMADSLEASADFPETTHTQLSTPDLNQKEEIMELADYMQFTKRNEINTSPEKRPQNSEWIVNSLEKSKPSSENSTMMFFELLGTKVVEANLPTDVNRNLESKVFKLVYGAIDDYRKSQE